MRTTRINGVLFEKMVINGLNNIRKHEKEVNEMNVFPVPDGVTGVNMRLTLENGVKNTKKTTELCEYLKKLTEGMLLGARGNSGVILSQIFQGFYKSMSSYGSINVLEMKDALIDGYKQAYRAVVRPVEGTILTVCREGIEKIKNQIDRVTSFEGLFSMYLAEMRKSLSYTPEILKELKDAGVVDSGGQGYIYIVDGMLKALYGEEITYDGEKDDEKDEIRETNDKFFDENSSFDYGYCMEFVLQLMNKKADVQSFSLQTFIDDLKTVGDSLVAVKEKTRVKVHIHTLTPATVINYCQQFGEFVHFSLNNMQLEHNEYLFKKVEKESKKLAIVCVVNGTGIKETFIELGADVVIEGGATMNVSAQEVLQVIRNLNAENIVVFPNNKNAIFSVEQAVQISGKKNVTVLHTKNVVENYFALAMDNASSDDVEYRINQMKNGIAESTCLCVAVATKKYSHNGVSCNAGDYIVLKNGELMASSDDLDDVIETGLNSVDDIDFKDSCIVFRGLGVTDEMREILQETFEDEFPDIEVKEISGGQNIFAFIIGL